MINRIEPAGPAQAYKTYRVAQPLRTHWRPATCAEVDCEHHAYGWRTLADIDTDDGVRRARYIVDHAGRAYTWSQAGSVVTFTFAPGQQCFAEHHVPLERDPLFLVRGGDWRGNPGRVPTIKHTRADDWVDDFATHQINVAQQLERG